MIGANLILLGGFFFTRYGQERITYVSRGEWDAVQYLYQTAPARSFLVEGWVSAPLAFEDYEKYDVKALAEELPDAVIHSNIKALVQFVVREKAPNSYIIFTQEQQIVATATYGLPPNALQRIETGLLQTREFKLIYSTSDAQILRFTG